MTISNIDWLANEASPMEHAARTQSVPSPLQYSYAFEEVILEVQGVHVSYDVPILRDVNFTLRNIVRPGHTQGQINAILGPSGMGKSQLFRVIAGLQKPQSGTVLVHGNPVKVGDVGVVYQDYPLFPHLTGWDNLKMAARLKHRDPSKREELIYGYLEMFGLTGSEAKYPHELSGGQRQRFSIIQQVLSCGNLMLLDEPFASLDVLRTEEVQALLQRIAAEHEHNSLIITTHDIQAALAIADTVHILGRKTDEKGNRIPGAKLTHHYNLMDMGITWRPENHLLPQFHELEKEIVARFHEIV